MASMHPPRTPANHIPLLAISAPDSFTSSRMGPALSISFASNLASHLASTAAPRSGTSAPPTLLSKPDSIVISEDRIPFDIDNPMPSLQFLEAAPFRPAKRTFDYSLSRLISAINENNAFVAYTSFLKLTECHKTSQTRIAVAELAPRLIPLLSRKLGLRHNARLAVEQVMNFTHSFRNQDFIFEWLFVLQFRENLPIDEVWDVVDQRERHIQIARRMRLRSHEFAENQEENNLKLDTRPSTTSIIHPLLGRKCLKFMLEAHLRRQHSAYLQKDPILLKEPLVYDYIARKRIILSPLLAENLMEEYARFNDAEGAKGLWARIIRARDMPPKENFGIPLQPTNATAEHFVTALTRRRGDVADSGNLNHEIVCAIADFKALGIRLSDRMFNSILRWCGSFDGNIYGKAELEAARLFWFNQMLNAANGEEATGTAVSCTPDFATLTILFQLALHAAELANSRNDSIMSCNLSTLWNSPLPSNDMSMVPQMLSAMIELTFKALETGVVDPLPHNCPPIRVTDLVNRYTEASIKYCRSTDRIAPFIILASYHVSRGNHKAAIQLLPIVAKIGIQPTSRFYAELLKGALVAGDESAVEQLSNAMVSHSIKLDKYVYQQFIKADIQCGKLENAMKLFNYLIDVESVRMGEDRPVNRSRLHSLDDYIISDIISELGRAGHYDLLFASYSRLKNRHGGFRVGPRLVSKLLEYSTPRLLLDVRGIHGATTSLGFSQSDSQIELKVDSETQEPDLVSSKPKRTPPPIFYAPMSPMEIFNDYMAQSGSKLDNKICSAVLHAVIRSNMPQSVIPHVFNRFRESGMAVDAFMVVHTAEAFHHVLNVEGIDWCITLLKEMESSLSPQIMVSLWKRIWMASLDANTKQGLLNGMERALAALVSLHGNQELGQMEKSRILKAVDNVLQSKGLHNDGPNVERLTAFMKGLDVVIAYCVCLGTKIYANTFDNCPICTSYIPDATSTGKYADGRVFDTLLTGIL
ncbi:hypothetical protein BC830DRAFT_1163696 [Chytriomyces sp. MP71]|nr:hypothetical protein BC830DRAFT_1163696 [Chytriomyces sp. MP71]